MYQHEQSGNPHTDKEPQSISEILPGTIQAIKDAQAARQPVEAQQIWDLMDLSIDVSKGRRPDFHAEYTVNDALIDRSRQWLEQQNAETHPPTTDK